MRQALIFLVVMGLCAVPVSAQEADSDRIIKLKISGTALFLADPFASPQVPVMPIFAGHGNLGDVTGQGLYLYQQFVPGPTMDLVCLSAQAGLRFDSSGDTLLLVFTPGLTGKATIADVGTMVWQQTWSGTIAGGTGRFSGAKGTFTKIATGFGVLIGSVSPYEGTIEIHLDSN